MACGSCRSAFAQRNSSFSICESYTSLIKMLSAQRALRVSFTVLQALGIVLTTWRLYIRLKIRRFWWEDTWAAVLLLASLVWMTAQWVYALADGSTSLVAQWIYSLSFTTIVTLARMSVLFSVIRIIHGNPRLLKFTHGCVLFFVTSWMVLIGAKVARCALSNNWRTGLSGLPCCQLTPHISMLEFTINCVAVAILVILPLRMLWRVKLPRPQKRMILSVFASSIVLAFGAIFHAIGQALDIVVLMVAGMNIEVTLSLWVCNLLVIVAYAYRFILDSRSGSGTTMEDTTSVNDDFTTRLAQPVRVTTSYLTTVDLDIQTGCAITEPSEVGVVQPHGPTAGSCGVFSCS